MNGFDVEATREEKYETFIALVERRLSEEEFAALLRQRMVPVRPG